MSCIEGAEPTPFEEFYRVPNQDGPDFKSFGEECIQTLLKVGILSQCKFMYPSATNTGAILILF